MGDDMSSGADHARRRGTLVVCAVFLVVDVVYGPTAAILATGATAVVYGLVWVVLPLLRRGEPEP